MYINQNHKNSELINRFIEKVKNCLRISKKNATLQIKSR